METSDDNVMIVETETSSDVTKKRKIEASEGNSLKKRKLEINDVDDDISIIENDINNDMDKVKSNFKTQNTEEKNDDCLIVHDDNKSIVATSQ